MLLKKKKLQRKRRKQKKWSRRPIKTNEISLSPTLYLPFSNSKICTKTVYLLYLDFNPRQFFVPWKSSAIHNIIIMFSVIIYRNVFLNKNSKIVICIFFSNNKRSNISWNLSIEDVSKKHGMLSRTSIILEKKCGLFSKKSFWTTSIFNTWGVKRYFILRAWQLVSTLFIIKVLVLIIYNLLTWQQKTGLPHHIGNIWKIVHNIELH